MQQLLQPTYIYVVGAWTNRFEKYARQIGSFPQGSGIKIPHIWVATTQTFPHKKLMCVLWSWNPPLVDIFSKKKKAE